MTIEHVTEAHQIDIVRTLFREYERSLGVDLCFKGFEDEVASLPGRYAPPRGRLLLATEHGVPLGCVALRPIGEDLCEMKRLYLRPEARGKGAGRALVMRVIEEARAICYRAMRLDTLPSMTEAFALYTSIGFRPIEPYYPNPVPGTCYLELLLRSGSTP